MTPTIMSIPPLLTAITITCVIIQRRQLLMALLALEATILSLVIMMLMVNHTTWVILVLVMLTFGACGASLGLACMVAMSRTYGNDHIMFLTGNKC